MNSNKKQLTNINNNIINYYIIIADKFEKLFKIYKIIKQFKSLTGNH